MGTRGRSDCSAPLREGAARRVLARAPHRRLSQTAHAAASARALLASPAARREVFDNGLREPAQIEREDEREGPRKGAPIRTTAEAYMLFKKGLRPVTEFEVPGTGKRATLGRRRAELSVREYTPQPASTTARVTRALETSFLHDSAVGTARRHFSTASAT